MRLFVAVRPPEDVLAALAGLARPEHPGLRWSTRDQWHVTLRFLGDVDDPDPVAAALVAAPLAPTEAVVGPEVVALNPRVLCVPVAGLDDLAAAVAAADLPGVRRPPEDRPFRGHLTLARLGRGRRDRQGSDRQGSDRQGSDRQGSDRQGSDRQGSDRQGTGGDGRGRRGRLRLSDLAGTPLAARFPVRDVRLVRSHLGPAGARYEDLAARSL
jgi:2'-5' RNA ligase